VRVEVVTRGRRPLPRAICASPFAPPTSARRMAARPSAPWRNPGSERGRSRRKGETGVARRGDRTLASRDAEMDARLTDSRRAQAPGASSKDMPFARRLTSERSPFARSAATRRACAGARPKFVGVEDDARSRRIAPAPLGADLRRKARHLAQDREDRPRRGEGRKAARPRKIVDAQLLDPRLRAPPSVRGARRRRTSLRCAESMPDRSFAE